MPSKAAKKKAKNKNKIKSSDCDTTVLSSSPSKTTKPRRQQSMENSAAGFWQKTGVEMASAPVEDQENDSLKWNHLDSGSSVTGKENQHAPCHEEKNMETECSDSKHSWKGIPINCLKVAPECLPKKQKLEASRQHVILIKTPFQYSPDVIPQPFDGGSFSSNDVLLPHIVQGHGGSDKSKSENRWEVIKKALEKHIRGPFELEEAVLTYNQRYINKWNFNVLHHFFIQLIDIEEKKHFFDHVLPEMVKLALSLPDICKKPIPFLKKWKAKKLTLSQEQIACLLANAFFCTFPNRNSRTIASGFSSYPDINFNKLFHCDTVPIDGRKLEKLRCIIHYFKTVLFKMPSGIVTFSRQILSSGHDWKNSMDSLTNLHVSSDGTIEDDGRGMLQVDFANKYLGGGVLGHGCVQEEIRFLICPEMIITRLFTESLDDLECLVMTGCERFSKYEGYADSFKWKGGCEDDTKRDNLGHLCCEVVAIDAQVFNKDFGKQFEQGSIFRELNKAYCGFKTSLMETHRAAVCTGNWGCGAFGGDKQLKALIQLMAASVAKRDVCYFTFGDTNLMNDLHGVHQELQRQKYTVGQIVNLMEDYCSMIVNKYSRHESRMSLFGFILHKLTSNTGWRKRHPSDSVD